MDKRIVLVVVLLSVVATASASEKEDQARELRERADRLTDVWKTPLKVTGEVRVNDSRSGTAVYAFALFWDGVDQWRVQWDGPAYMSIDAVGGGKSWHKSNVETPPFAVIQFRDALRGFHHWTDDGPFGPGEFSGKELRYSVVDQNIDGMPVRCLKDRKSGYVGDCYSADDSLPFAVSNNLGHSRYSEYRKVGNGVFPTSIRVTSDNGNTLLEGRLMVAEWNPVDPSMFSPIEGIQAVPIITCANSRDSAVPAHLVHQVRPEFPEAARRNYETGTVSFYAVIGKDGNMKRLDVVHSAGLRLDEAAREAVKKWRYSPYTKCGQPLEFETVITVNFALSK